MEDFSFSANNCDRFLSIPPPTPPPPCQGMDKEDAEEADLHYAELQNLPVSSREQCNGGTCTAALAVAPNNDYATVAELKGPHEEGIDQEPNQDNGGDDGVEENQLCVEME